MKKTPFIFASLIIGVKETLSDIVTGLFMYNLWGRLGWNDILQRYQRSILGPLWLTISMAVLIGALGLLYAKLFKVDKHLRKLLIKLRQNFIYNGIIRIYIVAYIHYCMTVSNLLFKSQTMSKHQLLISAFISL